MSQVRAFGRKAKQTLLEESDEFEGVVAFSDECCASLGLDDMLCAFDTEPSSLDGDAAPADLACEPPARALPVPPARRTAKAPPSPSASRALYEHIARLACPADRSPGCKGSKRAVPLVWPAAGVEIARLIDTEGADPNYVAFGCEPLIAHALGIINSDIALNVARILLQRGADVRGARASDGRSMADLALDLGDGELLRELLAAGALPTERCLTPYGTPTETVLALAREHGFEHDARAVLDSALAHAVGDADAPLVSTLLQHGARPHARALGGPPHRSVLHAALTAAAPLPLVRALLDARAPPAPRDDAGCGAMWAVVLRDDARTLRALLDAGARGACAEHDESLGASVLELCRRGDAPQCARVLAAYDAAGGGRKGKRAPNN